MTFKQYPCCVLWSLGLASLLPACGAGGPSGSNNVGAGGSGGGGPGSAGAGTAGSFAVGGMSGRAGGGGDGPTAMSGTGGATPVTGTGGATPVAGTGGAGAAGSSAGGASGSGAAGASGSGGVSGGGVTCGGGSALASDVVVNLADVHQKISGFGASAAWGSTMSAADADTLWSTTTGAGLSLHRIRIDYQTGHSSELNIAKLAVARGVTVWAMPDLLSAHSAEIQRDSWA